MEGICGGSGLGMASEFELEHPISNIIYSCNSDDTRIIIIKNIQTYNGVSFCLFWYDGYIVSHCVTIVQLSRTFRGRLDPDSLSNENNKNIAQVCLQTFKMMRSHLFPAGHHSWERE